MSASPLLSDVEAALLVENATRRAAYATASVARLALDIRACAVVVAEALRGGGRVLVAGNGGSAACAQHFAAEFTGKLSLDRPPYAAIALNTDTSALTAIGNDYGYDDVFARQVMAHGRPGDVFVALSTSGRSGNIVRAVDAARATGLTTIDLTGPVDQLGGQFSLRVPTRETARIQEAHDLILHEIAQLTERMMVPLEFDGNADRFPFLLDHGHLLAYRRWLDAAGTTLVTTNGAFDLFHRGHRASLEKARELGDRLVVLINSDESVRAQKGSGRPIRPLEDRVADLHAVTAVDHVVVFTAATPVGLIEVLRPDVHVKGGEYASRALPERATVEAAGGRIELLPVLDGYSTTAQERDLRGSVR